MRAKTDLTPISSLNSRGLPANWVSPWIACASHHCRACRKFASPDVVFVDDFSERRMPNSQLAFINQLRISCAGANANYSCDHGLFGRFPRIFDRFRKSRFPIKYCACPQITVAQNPSCSISEHRDCAAHEAASTRKRTAKFTLDARNSPRWSSANASHQAPVMPARSITTAPLKNLSENPLMQDDRV